MHEKDHVSSSHHSSEGHPSQERKARMRTSRFSSLRRSFKHGLFRSLLGLLLLSGMLGTTAILLKPPTAHAQSVPIWCQNWDPNPANTSNKQILTEKVTLSDHSIVEIDFGTFNGVQYEWANMANGVEGDLIALQWVWSGNNQTYQCGDSSGGAFATVWSNGGDTWTAGVPLLQNVGPTCVIYTLTNNDFGSLCPP